MTKAIGIDPGDVRIGVAVSDDSGTLARPLCIVDRKKPAPAKRLLELAARENATVIVMGLPLNTDGTEGPAALKAKWFADKLRAEIGDRPISVVLWDERYSSEDALEKQREAGVVARKDGLVDDWAAALILQDWLDSTHTSRL